MVDRKLVTNLIVTYHTRRRSPEVLELMSRILSFSEEDKRKVGLSKDQRNFVGGLLSSVIAPPPVPDLPAEQVSRLILTYQLPASHLL